jgi:hypothetical protein
MRTSFSEEHGWVDSKAASLRYPYSTPLRTYNISVPLAYRDDGSLLSKLAKERSLWAMITLYVLIQRLSASNPYAYQIGSQTVPVPGAHTFYSKEVGGGAATGLHQAGTPGGVAGITGTNNCNCIASTRTVERQGKTDIARWLEPVMGGIPDTMLSHV